MSTTLQFRIALDASDFRCLINGGTVIKKFRDYEIQFILSDIGFQHMLKLVADAMDEVNKVKDQNTGNKDAV